MEPKTGTDRTVSQIPSVTLGIVVDLKDIKERMALLERQAKQDRKAIRGILAILATTVAPASEAIKACRDLLDP